MKKNLLTVLSFVLLCSTLVFAQTLDMRTYGVSPRDVADDAADIFDIAYNALANVGVGTQMYFLATVGDELDDDDNVIAAGDLGALVWTLTSRPLTSAAVLGANADLDEENQVQVFTPDIIGTYVIEVTDGVNTLEITINAGQYIGVEDGNCGLCHEEFVEMWEETGHYSLFEEGLNGIASDHYGANCISCHTTGFDANADNMGFDDRGFVFPDPLGDGVYDQALLDFPNAMKLARIQCESCHGPGYGHGGATSMDVSLDSDMCAWCHDSGTHHAFPEQWDHSGHDATEFDGRGFHGGHAVGAFVESAGGRNSCAHCHSGAGFIAWVKKGADATLTAEENPTPTNIGCATCHDPHSDALPFQLRNLSTTLGDGTVVDFETYGTGALCMTCHKSRRYALEYAVDPGNMSSHFGAHHGPQADMLLGVNSPFAYDLPSSPHASATENACVDCHMFGELTIDGEINPVGGHTWNMNDADGNDNIGACAQDNCHAAFGANFADKKYYINGNADLDGDGTAEGLQHEVHGLMAELALLLPPVGEPEVDLSLTFTSDQTVGTYVYMWIEEDRSFGVHNPAFTVAMLIEAILLNGGTTDIDMPEDYNSTPQEFTLAQNYPNPFNPSTNIQFSLPDAGNVRITVYDTIGREVAVLIDQDMSAGRHEVTWNAANMSTGIYFYKMQSNDFVTVKKMMLMK